MTKASPLRWAVIGVVAVGLSVLIGLVPFVGGNYYAHIGILVFLNITLVLGYRLLCLTGLYSFCHVDVLRHRCLHLGSPVVQARVPRVDLLHRRGGRGRALFHGADHPGGAGAWRLTSSSSPSASSKS